MLTQISSYESAPDSAISHLRCPHSIGWTMRKSRSVLLGLQAPALKHSFQTLAELCCRAGLRTVRPSAPSTSSAPSSNPISRPVALKPSFTRLLRPQRLDTRVQASGVEGDLSQDEAAFLRCPKPAHFVWGFGSRGWSLLDAAKSSWCPPTSHALHPQPSCRHS